MLFLSSCPQPLPKITSKANLVSMILKDDPDIQPFQMFEAPQSHQLTNYFKWYSSSSAYPVRGFGDKFEPYFIAEWVFKSFYLTLINLMVWMNHICTRMSEHFVDSELTWSLFVAFFSAGKVRCLSSMKPSKDTEWTKSPMCYNCSPVDTNFSFFLKPG